MGPVSTPPHPGPGPALPDTCPQGVLSEALALRGHLEPGRAGGVLAETHHAHRQWQDGTVCGEGEQPGPGPAGGVMPGGPRPSVPAACSAAPSEPQDPGVGPDGARLLTGHRQRCGLRPQACSSASALSGSFPPESSPPRPPAAPLPHTHTLVPLATRKAGPAGRERVWGPWALTGAGHGRGPGAELRAAGPLEEHLAQLLHFRQEGPVLGGGILQELTLWSGDRETVTRERPGGRGLVPPCTPHAC